MSDGTGFPARTITKLLEYEYEEIIIKVGIIYNERVIITDIEKVEWKTRIKPTKKCVHMIKYYDMSTGKDGELNAEIFWKYFVRVPNDV